MTHHQDRRSYSDECRLYDFLLEQSSEARGIRDYDRAYGLINDAIELQPNRFKAYYRRGLLSWKHGNMIDTHRAMRLAMFYCQYCEHSMHSEYWLLVFRGCLAELDKNPLLAEQLYASAIEFLQRMEDDRQQQQLLRAENEQKQSELLQQQEVSDNLQRPQPPQQQQTNTIVFSSNNTKRGGRRRMRRIRRRDDDPTQMIQYASFDNGNNSMMVPIGHASTSTTPTLPSSSSSSLYFVSGSTSTISPKRKFLHFLHRSQKSIMNHLHLHVSDDNNNNGYYDTSQWRTSNNPALYMPPYNHPINNNLFIVNNCGEECNPSVERKASWRQSFRNSFSSLSSFTTSQQSHSQQQQQQPHRHHRTFLSHLHFYPDSSGSSSDSDSDTVYRDGNGDTGAATRRRRRHTHSTTTAATTTKSLAARSSSFAKRCKRRYRRTKYRYSEDYESSSSSSTSTSSDDGGDADDQEEVQRRKATAFIDHHGRSIIRNRNRNRSGNSSSSNVSDNDADSESENHVTVVVGTASVVNSSDVDGDGDAPQTQTTVQPAPIPVESPLTTTEDEQSMATTQLSGFEACLNLGIVKMEMMNYPGAISMFFQSLQRTTKTNLIALCYNNIACCYVRQLNDTHALKFFNKAIELYPRDVLFFVNRMRTLKRLERYSEALSDCCTLLRLTKHCRTRAEAYADQADVLRKVKRASGEHAVAALSIEHGLMMDDHDVDGGGYHHDDDDNVTGEYEGRIVLYPFASSSSMSCASMTSIHRRSFQARHHDSSIPSPAHNGPTHHHRSASSSSSSARVMQDWTLKERNHELICSLYEKSMECDPTYEYSYLIMAAMCADHNQMDRALDCCNRGIANCRSDNYQGLRELHRIRAAVYSLCIAKKSILAPTRMNNNNRRAPTVSQHDGANHGSDDNVGGDNLPKMTSTSSNNILNLSVQELTELEQRDQRTQRGICVELYNRTC